MAGISFKDGLGIAAVSVAACAVSVAVVTADVPSPNDAVAVNSSVNTKSDAAPDDQKPIAASQWNPDILRYRFQGPAKPEEPVRPPIVAAPVAAVVVPPLPFQLTGTILEDQARFAVVRDNGGKEFVVREGASVAAPYEAISLKSVDARSAVFVNSGAEQTLTMKPPANLVFE